MKTSIFGAVATVLSLVMVGVGQTSSGSNKQIAINAMTDLFSKQDPSAVM